MADTEEQGGWERYLRRSDWWGAKRMIKRLLSSPLLNPALQLVGRRLSPQVAARLPVAVQEVEAQVGGAHFVMRDPGRCVIAKEFYWGNGQHVRGEERHTLQTFAKLARQADIVLDIGAYTGVFALAALAANSQLRAHVFEIVPETYRLLFDNCVRNDFLDRVTCHHIGIGNPSSQLRVPAATGRASLPTSFSIRRSFESGVRVRVEALDALLPLLPDRSRVLMKIDVEGEEATVLAHGREFLRRFRPDIISEILPETDVAMMESMLSGLGYRFGYFTLGGFEVADRLRPIAGSRDWLLTTRDVDGGDLEKLT